MKYIKLFLFLMLLNPVQHLSADEFPYGYLQISGNVKTNLKVSSNTCKIYDMQEIGHGFDYRYIKPSNDSSFLKQVKGIIIESALIDKIDESFFQLRTGDTIDGIIVNDTRFDYADLIRKLIRYKINLSTLELDLKYVDNFPDDVEKILGLKTLIINFNKKYFEIKSIVFETPSLKGLVIKNAKKIITINSSIDKIKNLQNLEFYDCDSVEISKNITEKKYFKKLTLINNNIIQTSYRNIENCRQLESLTIENCKLSDNQIKFDELINLKFLNLRNNILSSFPVEVLQIRNLSNFLLSKNEIRYLRLDHILKLPKREKSIYISISDTFLNLEDKILLKSNKGMLDSNGYNFHCFDYYNGASRKY